MLRAAGCYGVNTVFYTGVRYGRAKEFVTDTKKAHQKIPLLGIEDQQQVIPLGCTPVAVSSSPQNTSPDRSHIGQGQKYGRTANILGALGEQMMFQRNPVNGGFNRRIE